MSSSSALAYPYIFRLKHTLTGRDDPCTRSMSIFIDTIVQSEGKYWGKCVALFLPLSNAHRRCPFLFHLRGKIGVPSWSLCATSKNALLVSAARHSLRWRSSDGAGSDMLIENQGTTHCCPQSHSTHLRMPGREGSKMRVCTSTGQRREDQQSTHRCPQSHSTHLRLPGGAGSKMR
eukprot:1142602-Pelagomonas_calceolata.AAC.4